MKKIILIICCIFSVLCTSCVIEQQVNDYDVHIAYKVINANTNDTTYLDGYYVIPMPENRTPRYYVGSGAKLVVDEYWGKGIVCCQFEDNNNIQIYVTKFDYVIVKSYIINEWTGNTIREVEL